MNHRNLKSLLVAALVCCLSASCSFLTVGCTTLPEGDKALIVHYAIAKAVGEVVKKDPARAERIVAIAGAVRQLAGNEQVSSVAMLDAFIRSKIDWSKLDAADQVMVNLLLERIKQRLEAKIGADPITGAKLLVVAEIAGWIEDAARASLPPTPAK